MNLEDVSRYLNMKLDDPFGRLADRDRRGYDSLRQKMQQAGVDTIEAAERIMDRTRRNVLAFSATVLLGMMLIYLLFPKMAPIAAALALFLLVNAASALIRGRRYIKRFIDEELIGKCP